MPTVSPSSDRSIDLGALVGIDADTPLKCECAHSDDPDDRCGDEATVRVTVVCVAEGCDSASGVYLLCHDCLAAWQDSAGSNGVELRVTPL